MDTFTSHSPEDTRRLGRTLSDRLGPGWVLGITGELGAGKTQLVKGVAEGLGIPGRIQSPTFALVIEHRSGRCPMDHLDLYRLDGTEDILAAGLGDYLHPRDSLSIVEWYDRWTGPTPSRLCLVHLAAHGGETGDRIITVVTTSRGTGFPPTDPHAPAGH